MSKKEERLAAFERQVGRLERRLEQLDSSNARFWQMKLGLIFSALLINVVLFRLVPVLFLPSAGVAFVLFLFLEGRHKKLRASFVKHSYLLQVTHMQLARMRLDWAQLPSVMGRDEQGDHPFDSDLDITGERSLQQLVNTGISHEGKQRLGDWLLMTSPDPEAIHERQTFVRELTPMTMFREKLMLHSLLATRASVEELEGQKFLFWLNVNAPSNIKRSALVVPTLLSFCTIITMILSTPLHFSIDLCLIPAFVSLCYYLLTRRDRGALYSDAFYLRSGFGQLQDIFTFLERYPYGKHLQVKRLCEPFFRNPDKRPSVLLRRIVRLSFMSMFQNAEWLGLVVNALVPVDIYVAYLLSQYREQLSRVLPTWLEIWFELEALCSLANFAYLNPDYVMPELITKPQAQPSFEAQALGHPLLADEKKVANDVALKQIGSVMLITGSNMAGKSTFLRTIGINLCLAYAGGPVNARSLRTTLFEIYACIKVTDSVTDGYSYFYAEVRRLRALLTRLELPSGYPIIFFIDEIFKGTNNRERLIGSTAYIHALVDKNCLGAITTHDLELIHLAEKLPHVYNYHFREEVLEGRMVFDYKLHPGPCPTTNALKIMELEGLPTSY